MRLIFKISCIAVSFLLASCAYKQVVLKQGTTITKNSKKAQEKPYVILISLDGFRWDYVQRFKPPHLTNFIKEGTQAEGLIPSFPTKTFPNHYTIATGMYPDNHNLVGNTFFSYDNNAKYRIRDREKVQNGKYYGGTPIWVNANTNGIVTASYFFVGSEAEIQGVKPTYSFDYNGKTSNETRVNQALDWLQLPAETRPHLITMYFSDMDDIGHKYGPNNDEKLKEKLFPLDKVLGKLFTEVKQTKLPVNIIIVSDHGMLEVNTNNFISSKPLVNDELYSLMNNGVIINVHPKEDTTVDEAYNYLKTIKGDFKVYKTKDAPYFEYTPKNKNWGAIQIIPAKGKYFTYRDNITPNIITGQHGFDANLKEMHGIFYANGPQIKEGHTVAPFKNIHIYPLLCELLAIPAPKNIDGKLKEIKEVLK